MSDQVIDTTDFHAQAIKHLRAVNWEKQFNFHSPDYSHLLKLFENAYVFGYVQACVDRLPGHIGTELP